MVLADDEAWLQGLPVNPHGLKILPEPTALELARVDGSGWYVAPHATKWTVGKAAACMRSRTFHILDAEGEPLRFETVEDAYDYLQGILGADEPMSPAGGAPASTRLHLRHPQKREASPA